MIKKLFIGVAAVVLLLVIVVAAVMAPAFAGLKPMQDGAELPGGAKRVIDGYTSAYVLPLDDKEVVLVDCGNDLEAKAIKAELARRGLGFAAVKAIFLTHGHPDHIGGCKQFPQATVYVGEGDRGLAEATEAGKGFIPSLAGPQKQLALAGVKAVKDGDELDVGPLHVKVFILPGHTAGSAAFLVNGALFIGDSLSIEEKAGRVRAAPGVFSDDPALNVSELKRLGKRLAPDAAGIKVIVPAHSGESAGFQPLLDYAGS